MKAILLTGGVGDIITVEYLMTDEERESISCICYATRAMHTCQELFNSVPTFPNLKSQVTLWKDFKRLFGFHDKESLIERLQSYKKEDLQMKIGELENLVDDYSISRIFYQNRSYTYSSFIRYKIAEINKFQLPEKYYCICPYSINDKRDSRRDYDEKDWKNTLTILKNLNIKGVVLNQGKDIIPQDESLINLSNQTNIKEAIEITKRCSGYIGIDSALSVIATKVCVAENLIIKSLNAHLYRWAHLYYHPHLNPFPFVKKFIG
jgi:hypothetical protein